MQEFVYRHTRFCLFSEEVNTHSQFRRGLHSVGVYQREQTLYTHADYRLLIKSIDLLRHAKFSATY